MNLIDRLLAWLLRAVLLGVGLIAAEDEDEPPRPPSRSGPIRWDLVPEPGVAHVKAGERIVPWTAADLREGQAVGHDVTGMAVRGNEADPAEEILGRSVHHDPQTGLHFVGWPDGTVEKGRLW